MSEKMTKGDLKLGFGLMRLPKLPSGEIDVPQVTEMVDLFMEAGGTYFDTAFVYDNGGSEAAIRKALVERYPRDSYTLATKLHAGRCADEAEARRQFYTSLERTGAGYFDFYLLHALQRNYYKKYDEYHIWDFVKELKAKGLVRHYGFSFHADPELLEELLTAHPDVDFVQLQINYADWDNPGVASRRNWEICRAHGKPVAVMEPVKGGILASPPPQVAEVFKAADPNASVSSWAIRFAASLDGVITVLSGMSNVEQMADNLSYMADFKPLNEEEQAVVKKAQETLAGIPSIPCTSCGYCLPGCPMSINIRGIFTAMNMELIYGNHEAAKGNYGFATKFQGMGTAGECVACGQCESVCPQHISIIDELKRCAAAFEG